MLSEYNKSNQLVIQMSKLYEDLYEQLIVTTKRVISFMVILVILAIIWSARTKDFIYIYNTSVTLMLMGMMSVKNIKACRLRTVENIFNSEKYAVININNEQITALIGKLHNAMGRLDYTNNMMLLLTVCGIIQMTIINIVLYFI